MRTSPSAAVSFAHKKGKRKLFSFSNVSFDEPVWVFEARWRHCTWQLEYFDFASSRSFSFGFFRIDEPEKKTLQSMKRKIGKLQRVHWPLFELRQIGVNFFSKTEQLNKAPNYNPSRINSLDVHKCPRRLRSSLTCPTLGLHAFFLLEPYLNVCLLL